MSAPSPASPPPVAVVIPVRNGADVLGDQLEAMAGQDHAGPWELVVSDNGSTDGTADLLAAWGERLLHLRVVDGSQRRGSNPARNAAVSATPDASVLLFCDADDVVAPTWVRSLVDALDTHPIATGPVVLVDARGVERSRSTGVPRYFGTIPFALGASLGIRREVFDTLGGFADSPPGVSASDVELGIRAAAAGYRIGFAPEATIVKRRRPDLRGTYRQWYGYGRGARWIGRRHRGIGLVRWSLRRQVRTLGWLMARPGRLRLEEGRRQWVCWAGQATGWVVGGWTYRRVPPLER